MKKIILKISILLLSLQAFSSAYALDDGENNESVILRMEYSFMPPTPRFGQYPGIFIDMLYLLNNSVWKASDGSPLISENQAAALGLAELKKEFSFLETSDLSDVKLERPYIKTPNDVWYYKVSFDAKSKEPFSLEGHHYPDLYYAIVLMNGSALKSQTMDWNQHANHLRMQCKYSKLQSKWTRSECTAPNIVTQ